MLADLKPYPAMRDSGLPWCPEVPEHWELNPNRAYLRQRKVLVGDRHKEYTLLSLTKRGVIVRDLTQSKGKFSADMGTSQEVRSGDLVMCLFDVPETPRTVGLSEHDGMITGAYTVFDLQENQEARWLELFYLTMDDQKALSPLYSGLRNTIRKSRFLGTKTPIPPLAEQAAIVHYLDHFDRRAQRLLRAKRKLIALLTEQKQAIMHRTVTRGLDPNVPLKDSGVEWLGEVPEHWEVVSSKALFAHRKEKASEGDEMLTASQAHGIIPRDEFIEKQGRVMQVITGADILKRVEPNDFVISMRSFQGGLEWSKLQGAVSSAYVTLVPKKDVYPHFFSYLFKTKAYITALRRTSDLVRDGQALRYANFAQVPLPVIPRNEQKTIAEHLDKATADIDTTIARAECEIELLTEYRTRLIADVVTGKLDVREAAAALPEVDPLAEDDHAGDLDADLALDADEFDEAPEEAEA